MHDQTPPPSSDEVTRHAADAETLEISLAASPDAAARARAELTAWLRRRSVDGTLADDARLLASELVTNGLRHARITPDQPLRLTVAHRAATLRVELHDHGTDGTVAWRAPRQHDGAGGFGLDLVAQLSTAWGVERDAQGTTVWLELPADASTAPSRSSSRRFRSRPPA